MQSESQIIYHGIVISKKNAKRAIRNSRTGQLGVVLSPKARANQNDMIRQFKFQKFKCDIEYPVAIHIDIFEPDWHRRDLDNQATSIMDALKDSTIIEDDGIKFVSEVHIKLVGVDKKNPRAEITIKHAGGDDD